MTRYKTLNRGDMQIRLGDAEVKVLLALSEDRTFLNNIVTKTGLSRTRANTILDKLAEKGLVSDGVDQPTLFKYFEPTDLGKLSISMLRSK